MISSYHSFTSCRQLTITVIIKSVERQNDESDENLCRSNLVSVIRPHAERERERDRAREKSAECNSLTP